MKITTINSAEAIFYPAFDSIMQCYLTHQQRRQNERAVGTALQQKAEMILPLNGMGIWRSRLR